MTFTHARKRYICPFDFPVMLRVIDALNLFLKVRLFQKYLVCDYLPNIHMILDVCISILRRYKMTFVATTNRYVCNFD